MSVSNDFTSMNDANLIAMIATVAGSSKISKLELEQFIDAHRVDDPIVRKIIKLIAKLDDDFDSQSEEIKKAVLHAQEWARRNCEVHALHPIPTWSTLLELKDRVADLEKRNRELNVEFMRKSAEASEAQETLKR